MAPKRVSTPPTIQARYTIPLEPTARIISWGTRKMPLPMMVPTTIAVACHTPSTRGRSGAKDVLGMARVASRKMTNLTARGLHGLARRRRDRVRWMEIVVNGCGQVGGNHRGQRLLAGALNPTQAAEVGHQPIPGL